MAEGSEIRGKEIRAAHAAIAADVIRTPTLSLPAIDEMLGGPIALKAENLQQTGSFKARGVSVKLASLGEDCARGVVAGTAGNHGRALAWAAKRRGIPCELFVPEDAPISKTEPAARLGADLTRCKGTVDDCVELAKERAEADGLTLVHPFDDPRVVTGQAGIGLELLEDLPDLAKVLVPLGGGGLASGVAIAVKSERPEVEVVGVQVEACASYPVSLQKGEPVTVKPTATVADGIAVKRPGDLTMPLVERWLDEVAVVSDDEVGDAMAELLGEAKMVVEGAGAVGVAALAAGYEQPAANGVTAIVLSGGNVDESLLAAIARRSGSRHGRGAVLFTTISDRPGSLARLLEAVGATGASVVDVRHVREVVDLHVAETGVELILDTRDPEHTDQVIDDLSDRGYAVTRQHTSERSDG
ncbi:MAG: pyridoxal-phosphate dependent enzyme [Solirubrobacterales bacterium]